LGTKRNSADGLLFVWRTNIANRKLVGDGDCAPWTGEIKAERMSAGALFGVSTGFRDRPMPTPSCRMTSAWHPTPDKAR
jgi:hypothetical protein